MDSVLGKHTPARVALDARSTDAAGLHPDEDITGPQGRIRAIGIFKLMGLGMDQSLHLSLSPSRHYRM